MKTIGVSAWMADCGKHFNERVEHLLGKPGVDAWVWIVRPTNDLTSKLLQVVAERSGGRVLVIEESWEKPADRILACSIVGDVAINAALMRGADRVLIHESDLISPHDLVERLSAVLDAAESNAVCGGWPCLASVGMDDSLMLCPGAARLGENVEIQMDDKPAHLPLFYDTWGYRHEGQRFASVPPFAPCYTADQPFRLDTVGSVALIKSPWLHLGARMEDGGFVGLCEKIGLMGGSVWCDPRITINQPLELWTFQNN